MFNPDDYRSIVILEFKWTPFVIRKLWRSANLWHTVLQIENNVAELQQKNVVGDLFLDFQQPILRQPPLMRPILFADLDSFIINFGKFSISLWSRCF